MGAESAAAWMWCWKGLPRIRTLRSLPHSFHWKKKKVDISRAAPQLEWEACIAFARMVRKIFIPIRLRVLNQADRMGGRVSWIRSNSNGPIKSWRGLKLPGQIIYELHVGTFTPEGTWQAAAKQLAELAKIGITVIEMMPVAEFAGPFGWGYDGVDLFAPSHLYGNPDDLRSFINTAHSLGMAVILDVVYNHFGPEGNYLSVFSGDYLTHRQKNDWGDSINFDGPNSGPVREFFITNGRYWIDEFHFDGFRFDATQSISDQSDEYIVGAIGRAARATAGERSLILVAENEEQEAKLVRPRKEGGDDLDGVWNDDWHHSAIVALTGRNEAYYSDYKGTPQEFISAAKYGYLYQGQPYSWQEALRGTSTFWYSPCGICFFP